MIYKSSDGYANVDQRRSYSRHGDRRSRKRIIDPRGICYIVGPAGAVITRMKNISGRGMKLVADANLDNLKKAIALAENVPIGDDYRGYAIRFESSFMAAPKVSRVSIVNQKFNEGLLVFNVKFLIAAQSDELKSRGKRIDRTMRYEHFLDTDTLSIEIEPGPAAETKEIIKNVLVDIGPQNRVIGVTIEHVSRLSFRV